MENKNAGHITKHLNNIFKEEELDRYSTCAKYAQVQMESEILQRQYNG